MEFDELGGHKTSDQKKIDNTLQKLEISCQEKIKKNKEIDEEIKRKENELLESESYSEKLEYARFFLEYALKQKELAEIEEQYFVHSNKKVQNLDLVDKLKLEIDSINSKRKDIEEITSNKLYEYFLKIIIVKDFLTPILEHPLMEQEDILSSQQAIRTNKELTKSQTQIINQLKNYLNSLRSMNNRLQQQFLMNVFSIH